MCLNYPVSGGAALESVTDTAGNAYDIIVGPVLGANDVHYIAVATNVHSGTNTLTVTLTLAPGGGSDLLVLEYRGLAFSNAFDATANMTGSGTAMDSGAATTTSGSELVVGFAEAASASPGAGFTRHAMQTGNIVEDMTATKAGSYSATATTTAGGWTMLMATFRGP